MQVKGPVAKSDTMLAPGIGYREAHAQVTGYLAIAMCS
jgi:hypothetical protein